MYWVWTNRRYFFTTTKILQNNHFSAGVFFGLLGDKSRKIGRDAIILCGTIVHLVVYALCYINFPQDSSLKKTDEMGGLIQPNLAIALIAGGLLGFGDAIWNTQIYSFLCDTFSKQSAQAFSLFKLYQVRYSETGEWQKQTNFPEFYGNELNSIHKPIYYT